MPNTSKPIQEVRLGCIKAAVWKNETENGARYNVTFCRLYKEGDQWRTTESYGRDDLLLLAKVADQTHSWVLAHQQEQTNHGAGARDLPGVQHTTPAARDKQATP